MRRRLEKILFSFVHVFFWVNLRQFFPANLSKISGLFIGKNRAMSDRKSLQNKSEISDLYIGNYRLIYWTKSKLSLQNKSKIFDLYPGKFRLIHWTKFSVSGKKVCNKIVIISKRCSVLSDLSVTRTVTSTQSHQNKGCKK